MDEQAPGASRRGRRRDARDNDARILGAALGILAHEGWGALHFSRVSTETHITVSPIRDRFVDRSALAAQVWTDRVVPALLAGMDRVVEAVPDPAACVEDPQAVTQRMQDALRHFEDPDDTYLAAIELIIVSRFDPDIAAAVNGTLGMLLDSWLAPSRGLAPEGCACRAYALSLAFGLLLLARGIPWPPVGVSSMVTAMCKAMCEDARPQSLPPQRAEHLDAGAVFDTGDPAWDALLQATLDSVGAYGYEGATLDVIARRSGYSTGVIQNRYASKRDLFIDATRRMLSAAVLLNQRFMQSIVESYSSGVADAVGMREFMARDRRLVRSISFEQIRRGWHDDEVASVVRSEATAALLDMSGLTEEQAGEMHFGLALGQGCALLADLCPVVADLPFDVVTVPMHEAFESP